MTDGTRHPQRADEQRSGVPAEPGAPRTRGADHEAQHPYLRYGAATGALGALVVALYFLLVDLVAGRPLATPTALGATLFLGEPFDLQRSRSLLLVLAYTATHGAIFLALASVASALFLGAPRRWPSLAGLVGVLFGALFVALTSAFLGFAVIFDLGIWNQLGGAQIAIANLLAAGAMALVLGRALRDHWDRWEPEPSRSGRRARHAEAR